MFDEHFSSSAYTFLNIWVSLLKWQWSNIFFFLTVNWILWDCPLMPKLKATVRWARSSSRWCRRLLMTCRTQIRLGSCLCAWTEEWSVIVQCCRKIWVTLNAEIPCGGEAMPTGSTVTLLFAPPSHHPSIILLALQPVEGSAGVYPSSHRAKAKEYTLDQPPVCHRTHTRLSYYCNWVPGQMCKT